MVIIYLHGFFLWHGRCEKARGEEGGSLWIIDRERFGPRIEEHTKI